MRTFRHFEVLAHEMATSGIGLLNGDPRALRISITVPGAGEYERVVHIPLNMEKKAEKARAAIHQALSDQGILGNREFTVAILARLTRELLAPSPKDAPEP